MIFRQLFDNTSSTYTYLLAEVPKDKPVVTLCRSGRRSALAVTILKESGFDKVASLRQGLTELTQV